MYYFLNWVFINSYADRLSLEALFIMIHEKHID